MSGSDSIKNPFPGPQPYRANDRERFFGREVLVKKLVNQLLARSATTIFGPSGAGKSSLMQAGVIPLLEETRDFRVVRVDAWPPNEEPLSWLVRVIYSNLELGVPSTDKPAVEALGMAMVLAEERSEQPILLYLDQLEQLLFTGRAEADAEALLGGLDRLVRAQIPGLQIALLLREDYLGRFRDRARDHKGLLAHGFRVGPLTVGEMVKAVCRAATEGEPAQTWEEQQLRALMLEVRMPGESASDDAEVQAAFGQIVCRALFQSRARGEEQGEVNAELILQRYLATTLEELGPLGSDARRLLEEHLVTPDGGRTLRTEKELLRIVSAEKLRPILEALERAAILRAEAHQGSRYFELGHDWLAKQVCEQKERRERDAEQSKRDAEQRKRDEEQAAAFAAVQAETTLLETIVGIAVIVMVVGGGIGAWAYFSSQSFRLEMAPRCREGMAQCAGNRLQGCSAGEWILGPPCESSTCVAGACVGVCQAGDKRCANDTPQECNVSGQWEGLPSCGLPKHCQGGQCVVSCAPGVDVGCLGNSPATCNINGEFQMTTACEKSTCVEGSCKGICALGDARCSAANDKNPEWCDAQGQWKRLSACAGACSSGSCPGPSCEGLPPMCGPNKNENCCSSPVAWGGTFSRSNNIDFPANVGVFRLDRFEVTVGRFRKFVDAYPQSKPRAGAGAHPHIEKSGWDASWDKELPETSGALLAKIKICEFPTWTDKPGERENLPMNCLSWYEAFAFCAWDGGRLPTEAEWNYAAAAGAEQRYYPWSVPPASQKIDSNHAVYRCAGDGNAKVCDEHDILPVGSRSPLGDGKWGQADLSGSVYEWVLDESGPHGETCNDCANVAFASSYRIARGGAWLTNGAYTPTHFRNDFDALTRDPSIFGVRCAKSP